MLIELIKGNGKSTGRKIAKSFLDYDESQIDYYSHITKTMPFKVLSKHLSELKRNKENYFFEEFDLDENQKQELIELCEDKLKKEIDKRGLKKIYSHRTLASGDISGSIRFAVLDRAKTKCEGCGIDNKDRALEVDHIKPRSRKGKDELSNYQALCYVCNTGKSNKSETNFRQVSEDYNYREKNCIFCKVSTNKIIRENELAFVIYDNYPVTKHHCLIIPKRHFQKYLELYQPEINAISYLINDFQII